VVLQVIDFLLLLDPLTGHSLLNGLVLRCRSHNFINIPAIGGLIQRRVVVLMFEFDLVFILFLHLPPILRYYNWRVYPFTHFIKSRKNQI
jgi:hypothetical protein